MLLTTDAVGGVWPYTLALAAGLEQRGCRCAVAVLGPAPDSQQRDEGSGIRLIETNLPLDWTAESPASLASCVAALAELAQALGVASVHLHAPTLAAGDWPVPTVAFAHSCVATWWDSVRGGELPDSLLWRRNAMARGMAAAHIVAAPSCAFAIALRDAYGSAATVIHNGLPWVEASPRGTRVGVLAAGRLWDDGKGMALLDDAAGLLGAPVWAAGPRQGPGGAAFQPRHMIALDILHRTALHYACAGAAVFAAPSRYEPFGLAVLEAAQLATPLVLSDIPTFRELWQGAAVFVEQPTPEAWAHTLAALLDDPDRRAALGAAARSRARTYGVDEMVDATLGLHQKLRMQ